MTLSQIRIENEEYMRRLHTESPALARKRQQAAAEAAERQRQAQAEQDEFKTREAKLLAARQARLTSEALEALSPSERKAYNAQYGQVATVRRLAEQAQAEALSKWEAEEHARQFDELTAWQKTRGVRSSRDDWEKIFELDSAGKQRAQARQEARRRRELEAEAFASEADRIVQSLDDEERAILKRLLKEQPSELEQIEAFIAEHRNQIAEVTDSRTLYRMAAEQMAQPRQKEYVPPTSEIESVTSSRTLYAMAERDAEQAKSKRKAR